jgi:hypothetical protein
MEPAMLPAEPRVDKLQALEDRITELAAHIHAATYRFLVLIREFDERDGWSGPGLKSCAHWLSWKCGIAVGAAREKVRVAHAFKDLPRDQRGPSHRPGQLLQGPGHDPGGDAGERGLPADDRRPRHRRPRRAPGARLPEVKRNEALEAENDRHELREAHLACQRRRHRGDQGPAHPRAGRAGDAGAEHGHGRGIPGAPGRRRADTRRHPPSRRPGTDRRGFLAGGNRPAPAASAAPCISTPTWTPCAKTARAPNHELTTGDTFPRKRPGAWPATAAWSTGGNPRTARPWTLAAAPAAFHRHPPGARAPGPRLPLPRLHRRPLRRRPPHPPLGRRRRHQARQPGPAVPPSPPPGPRRRLRCLYAARRHTGIHRPRRRYHPAPAPTRVSAETSSPSSPATGWPV